MVKNISDNLDCLNIITTLVYDKKQTMRTSVFKIRRPYNSAEIKDSISRVGTIRKADSLITTYNGRVVCETDISKKYFDFDFSAFTTQVLDEIDNYFSPDYYSLKISRGFQEIRLVGEDIVINGEHYSKMFNLLNSTNRMYALQMNIGLIRKSTGAGIILNTLNIGAGIVSRHFYKALPERVRSFVEKLKTFSIVIDKQAGLMEDLSRQEVSFVTVAKKFFAEPNRKTGQSSNLGKLRIESLGKQLLMLSYRNKTQLTAQQVKLLRNPSEALKGNAEDVTVSGSQIVTAYTEVYKNQNSCVQRVEAERILKAISK
jgi:hypothetical protein